jgi:ABC-type Na+ efflux pump permease subunit
MGVSFTIAKKEIKLLFKAKRRIILFFTVPIMLFVVAILSIVIGGLMIVTQGSDGPLTITVVDHAQDNNTLYIIENLKAYFIIETENNVTDPQQLVNSDNPPNILLYFPANFSSIITKPNETALFYLYYNNKELKYESVITVIDYYSRSLNKEIIVEDYGELNLNRVNYISSGTSSGVSASEASSLIIIPIYILMFFVIPPISLILISITQEREQKTLESLLLQPISRKAIVNGKILYGFILVVSNLFLTILTIAVLAVGVIYILSEYAEIDLITLIKPLITQDSILLVIYVILGLTLVSILLISLAVMISLLAKDEREGNMVISGVAGEIFLSSLPVIGFMFSLYITILTGSIGFSSVISLLSQTFFCLISIWFSSKLIEIEGILDINIIQALKRLVRLG